MSHKTKPGDQYWTLIDSAFDSVSIYEGPLVFSEQFSKLRPQVGHLLAAHWCQSEVCNGGFHQFFSNSTGVLAPEALEGFEAIGLTEWALLLRSAMNLLGSVYPRSCAQRQGLLPQPIEGKERDEWDTFYELDERFYSYLLQDNQMWEQAADAYAVRNAD